MLAAALAACSSLPQPPAVVETYDFGPGPTAVAQERPVPRAPIVLARVEASGLPDGTALRYRLAYANAQQPRPYGQSRWSQPPAELLAQALRRELGAHRAVLGPGAQGQMVAGTLPDVLRVDLEEFSQVFSTPEQSVGLVRVRASLAQGDAGGEQRRVQRVFVAQRPAATPDAAGGARALAEAAAQVAADVQVWLQQQP
ncbi:MAG: PqiC family protein [Burkholderiales bacterium]|nr:PqiC family protein [Burkholderiales bacterium]